MAKVLQAAFLCLLGTSAVMADFSYTQTTQLTGGSIVSMSRWIPGGGKMREPNTSTMMLKGNKLMTRDKDSATLIDVDAETMTQIDYDKKQYGVITFKEMQEAMKALAERMQQMQMQMRQQMEQSATAMDQAVEVNVSVNETGQTKPLIGVDTKQVVLSIVTTPKQQQNPPMPPTRMIVDNWMAPTLPGYEQVQEFYRRMAEKMAFTPGVNPMATMQPGMSKSMATMAKEMSKLKGIPVAQTVTMTGPGAPEGAAGEAAKQAAQQAATQSAAQSATSAIPGRAGAIGGVAGNLGGMFGRRKKKKEEEQQAQQQPGQPPQAPGGLPQVVETTLLEMVVQLSDLSNAPVEAAKVSVPAGFKEIEHPMKKMAREMPSQMPQQPQR